MSSSSNANRSLGLRPRTRKRDATHGSNIIRDATCPACRSAYVRETVINGQPVRSCGHCSARWNPLPSGSR
jgi:hypothetical protein